MKQAAGQSRTVITIAGLGPGDSRLLTVETADAIRAARQIVLRTAIHPSLDDLTGDSRVVVCDDLYEQGESFDAVYEAVANRVIEMAGRGDVLYLVPGHPRYGELVTPRIEALADERGFDVRVLAAVSAFDVIANTARRDLMKSEPQSIDATSLAAVLEREPFGAGLLDLSPRRPLIVTQVFSPEMAAVTKLALSRLYDDEQPIVLIRGAGTGEEVVESLPLYRLDRAVVDHLTTVWIDGVPEMSEHRTFAALVQVAARLRAPDGCPWDREQTSETLLPSLLEEAYEVVEALQSDDADHAAEELGDLLLHVVMQSQIAEEAELFRIEDVIESITRKLIRRHPHVFGSSSASSADDVLGIWQRVKAEERSARPEKPRSEHPVDRYPKPMPVARRLHDLVPAIAGSSKTNRDELADQLFAATRVAIENGFDPEQLLLEATRRAIPAD